MKRKAKEKVKTHVKNGTSKAAAAARKAIFIEAYVENGGNATQAAISAGYSARRARQTAAELVTDRDISEEIKRRRAQAIGKAQEKTQFTIDEVVLSMARAVRFDPRKLFTPVLDDDGNPKKDEHGRPAMRMLETWELDDDTALAVQAIEYDEIKGDGSVIGRTVKLKVCDRNIARDQAHKFFGNYEKNNRQRNPLAGFTLNDANELKAWLQANRPPDPEAGK